MLVIAELIRVQCSTGHKESESHLSQVSCGSERDLDSLVRRSHDQIRRKQCISGSCPRSFNNGVAGQSLVQWRFGVLTIYVPKILGGAHMSSHRRGRKLVPYVGIERRQRMEIGLGYHCFLEVSGSVMHHRPNTGQGQKSHLVCFYMEMSTPLFIGIPNKQAICTWRLIFRLTTQTSTSWSGVNSRTCSRLTKSEVFYITCVDESSRQPWNLHRSAMPNSITWPWTTRS